MTMISLQGITKYYGEHKVLEELSFELHDKEALAVVGESGCGKTTLLRIMAGLDADYEGAVMKDGSDIRKLEPNKRDMALVYQEPALWNHMTVEENIRFGAGKTDKGLKEKIGYVGERLEIGHLLSRRPHEISGGQAKRVSLARALVSHKQILLLDEPLTNIDREMRERVMTFLEEEYLGKRTIVFVSHDMDEVSRLCDRRIILDTSLKVE